MFEEFPKIPRLKRAVSVTEKIDGTNAQIYIADSASIDESDRPYVLASFEQQVMLAGSRNRWLIPGNDNFGFAQWVVWNREELWKLGTGRHFGEWWGAGIQRRYGLTEKRFSLFNTARWNPLNPNKPACCSVVPLLYEGDLNGVDIALATLRTNGSVAAPGFMNPEGIVVYHSASRSLYKVTLDNDEKPKSIAA